MISAAGQTAVSPDSCRLYQQMFESGEALSDKLLTADSQSSMRCLIGLMAVLKDASSRGEKLEQLTRVAGAMRILISSEENSSAGVNRAVLAFRNQSKSDKQVLLDAASTLAYAARSENNEARLNAVLVFGNVVDNQTVCVALDHLYAPEIKNAKYAEMSPAQIKGRGNLLSVVAVVAPWAYKENYENIRTMHREMVKTLNEKNPDELAVTYKILDTLQERLAYQDSLESPNKETEIPQMLRACEAYKAKWAGTKLKYK